VAVQGELQYFIGVQLDGSEYLEPERRRLSEKTEKQGAKVVQETANNIDGAVRELPDANMVHHPDLLYVTSFSPFTCVRPPWHIFSAYFMDVDVILQHILSM
jgi:hypothetical protein